ncbi:hypothetical protein [Salinigranum salinum]|uniref:hypothetical protein n=1 Tax=Salinigranum salinum TaxID=1364937 RepID=UPI001260BA5E|nr:hypothetical protein [Salinigranum salinum]
MSVQDEPESAGVSPPHEPDAGAHPDERAAGLDGRHRNWLHALFGTADAEHVPVVAAVASTALFFALYLLSVAWGLGGAFLDPSTLLGLSALLGCLGVFVVLTLLGTWTVGYTAVWRAVEPAFAVDDETYESFLDARLRRLYDVRPVVVLFVLLEPAFVLVVTDLNPTVPHDAVLVLVNAVLAFLVLTGVYMFGVHVGTVRRATEWELENVYTGAHTLEGLVRFSITVAVWWFVGVSLLAVYYWFALSDSLQVLRSSAGLGLAPAVPLFGVAGHATLLGLLIVGGFATVAVPVWQLHATLRAARSDLLAAVNARSHETVVGWTRATVDPDDAAARLDVAEQAAASVQQVRIWPFDRSGLLKLLLSALIPLSQFALTTVRGVLGLG